MVAKFWLHPLHLALGGGFDERELRRIEALLEERAGELLEFWDEFFAN